MSNPPYEESVFGYSYPKVPVVSRFSGRWCEHLLSSFFVRGVVLTNIFDLTWKMSVCGQCVISSTQNFCNLIGSKEFGLTSLRVLWLWC